MSREPRVSASARESTAGRSGISDLDRSIHDSVADNPRLCRLATLGSRLKRRSYGSPVEMLQPPPTQTKTVKQYRLHGIFRQLVTNVVKPFFLS